MILHFSSHYSREMFYRALSKTCISLIYLASSLVIADEEIPLEIHFFTPNQEQISIASNANSDIAPKMQMVIFGEEQQQAVYQDSEYPTDDTFSFIYYLDSSYQNDSLSWSVAAPNGRPDTLTEMKWKNINLIGFDTGFKVSLPENFVLKGEGGYAKAVSGNTRQIFYAQNGRNQAFSDIKADSDKGYSWHGSAGLGYSLDFGLETSPVAFNFTPLAGYAWHQQRLESDNGTQQLTAFNPNDPASLNTKLNYKTRWYGPWLGGDMSVSLFNKHQLFSTFQHHWATYKAEGRDFQGQNLQSKSFEHDTDATGLVASAGYRFLSDDTWGIKISVDYQKWDGESGNEVLFTSNDEQFKSRLNEVEWESLGVNLGINMRF